MVLISPSGDKLRDYLSFTSVKGNLRCTEGHTDTPSNCKMQAHFIQRS